MSATIPRTGVGPRHEGETGNRDRVLAGGGQTRGCLAAGCGRVFTTRTATNLYCSMECRRAHQEDRVREAARRLRDANLIDGDRLEHLYVDLGLSVDRIADMAGVGATTVERFLRLHGIPVRGRGRPARAVSDLFRRRRWDDQHNPPGLGLVEERMRAVHDALDDHDRQREETPGRVDGFPLRDALIDLAAVCLREADELAAPRGTLGDRL